MTAGPARSRGASKSFEGLLDELAHLREIGARIDDAHALRLRAGARDVCAAHAVEKRGVLALEAIERPAGLREPLARDGIRTVEDQRAVRAQARMRRLGEALDEIGRHALAGALVGGCRIREAV